MRINAGKITLAVATILAVVLAVGFVWVHFFGLDLAG
jgi:hypothetical protein